MSTSSFKSDTEQEWLLYASNCFIWDLLSEPHCAFLTLPISIMTTTIPETTKQWTVVGRSGSDSLQYSEQPVPPLGDNQVLVKSTPCVGLTPFLDPIPMQETN